MGFGKWLLGSACAVGAVIAAPVVLPVAGAAMIGSGAVGIAGSTALTATVVGKKLSDKARSEGRREGEVAASDEWKEKFRSQGDAVKKIKENCQQTINYLEKK